MSSARKIIIAVLAVAVIASGAFLLTNSKANEEGGQGGASDGASSTQTITYTEDGFSPATVTVAAGGSITFKNESGSEIEPSSDPHPNHTDNPELNAGDIEPGASRTITVTTAGTWGIHNHYSKDKRASITVE